MIYLRGIIKWRISKLPESLTNAVANGTHIWIKVNLIGSRLIVRVRDDGNGFADNAKIS